MFPLEQDGKPLTEVMVMDCCCAKADVQMKKSVTEIPLTPFEIKWEFVICNLQFAICNL